MVTRRKIVLWLPLIAAGGVCIFNVKIASEGVNSVQVTSFLSHNNELAGIQEGWVINRTKHMQPRRGQRQHQQQRKSGDLPSSLQHEDKVLTRPLRNRTAATAPPNLPVSGFTYTLQNVTHTRHNSKTSGTPSSDTDKKMNDENPRKYGGVWSRIYEPFPYDLPCMDPNEVPNLHWSTKKVQSQPTTDGIIFIKLLKTASSTSSGVTLRIARNLARRRRGKTRPHNNENLTTTTTTTATAATATATSTGFTNHITSDGSDGYEICKSRFLHGWAGPRMLNLKQRNKSQSVLWTMLREPTKRYMSDFFHFGVSRQQLEPTSTALIEYLRKYKHPYHSINWMTTDSFDSKKSNISMLAQGILPRYDFVGITERLDESFVVLSLLLDIPLGDILYLDSKRSGGYDDGQYENRCVFIQPTNVTADMRSYLDSPAWKKYVEPEKQLYLAANHSLDLTIQRLGRDRVAQRLQLYREAQMIVNTECSNITKFPCSAKGERRKESDVDCMTRDIGCGFECLDRVANSFEID